MTKQNNYFRTIVKIGLALGTTLERDKILQLIVQGVLEAMGGKAACLFLMDEEKGTYVPVAQTGLSKNYVHAGLAHVKKEIPLLLKKGYLHFRDAASDPGVENRETKRAEGIASILVVPVRVKGRFIGTLSLYTAKVRDFSAEEIEFLTVLAEQGGVAVETARLVERLRENTRIFLDLAASINSSLDIKDILQTLSCEVSQAIGVKAASIRLLDEESNTLKLVASCGLSEKYLNKGPISAEKSIAEALRGKPVVVRNASTDKGVQYKKEKKAEGIVTILSVPIKSKERVIGVLRLYSAVAREFTEDEILLVTALAYQGGLAIQNAGLYLMLKSDMKELKDEIWSHRCWF
ncbi:MAG TPA: diguanylate cyclase [Syntrophus sp. (in: bacteria)]|jgi:GAF domain-containing protein|nr:diguanylate cyclase [Syntrophus sp. (in: bacteria)]